MYACESVRVCTCLCFRMCTYVCVCARGMERARGMEMLVSFVGLFYRSLLMYTGLQKRRLYT